MPFVDTLLPEFDHEMTITRKVLERVPEDRLDWKPHAKSHAAGQLAQHVATIPMWGIMTLSEAEVDSPCCRPTFPADTRRHPGTVRFARRARARARRQVRRAELKAQWSLSATAT